MKVCVVGGGGREHALAHVLSRTADVVVSPGNPGMTDPIRVTGRPVHEIEADLVVIGPEAPLVDGLADRLRAEGRAVMGPGAAGALLEGSKGFMKQMLAEAGVPTARFAAFGAAQRDEALAYLRRVPGPWVVKTDGLAAGKGVLVARTLEEAEADVTAKLSGTSFGEAGHRIVIEEALEGEECSLLVLFDGTTAVPLLPAQDFKRVGDDDRGPNTGGMGAYAPMPHVAAAQIDTIMATAVEPLIATLRARASTIAACSMPGSCSVTTGRRSLSTTCVSVIRSAGGAPVALVRRGRVVHGGRHGTLKRIPSPTFSTDAAVCVVLASPGYPEAPRTGDPIAGLDASGQSTAGAGGGGSRCSMPGPAGPIRPGPFSRREEGCSGDGAGPHAPRRTRQGLRRARADPLDGMLVRSDIAARAAGDPPGGPARHDPPGGGARHDTGGAARHDPPGGAPDDAEELVR